MDYIFLNFITVSNVRRKNLDDSKLYIYIDRKSSWSWFTILSFSRLKFSLKAFSPACLSVRARIRRPMKAPLSYLSPALQRSQGTIYESSSMRGSPPSLCHHPFHPPFPRVLSPPFCYPWPWIDLLHQGENLGTLR